MGLRGEAAPQSVSSADLTTDTFTSSHLDQLLQYERSLVAIYANKRDPCWVFHVHICCCLPSLHRKDGQVQQATVGRYHDFRSIHLIPLVARVSLSTFFNPTLTNLRHEKNNFGNEWSDTVVLVHRGLPRLYTTSTSCAGCPPVQHFWGRKPRIPRRPVGDWRQGCPAKRMTSRNGGARKQNPPTIIGLRKLMIN